MGRALNTKTPSAIKLLSRRSYHTTQLAKIPGSPRISVLQAMESWAGAGNKASVFLSLSMYIEQDVTPPGPNQPPCVCHSMGDPTHLPLSQNPRRRAQRLFICATCNQKCTIEFKGSIKLIK